MPQSKKVTSRIQRKRKIRMKISGTAKRPRLVVFRSNQHISAQLVDDSDGKTLVSADDIAGKKFKGTKTERAGQVGKIIAEAAKAKNIEACLFDRNGYKYHGRIKALAESAKEAGLQF